MPDTPTPSSLGFRMPPEWAPHRGTWLSWPHKEASWPGKFERVPGLFARMVRELAEHEEVHINVNGAEMEADVRGLLGREGARLTQVFFHRIPTDDAWCRDHGPIFVHRQVNGRIEEAIVDWGYNAWGGKYPPFAQDDAVPARIGAGGHGPIFRAPPRRPCLRVVKTGFGSGPPVPRRGLRIFTSGAPAAQILSAERGKRQRRQAQLPGGELRQVRSAVRG